MPETFKQPTVMVAPIDYNPARHGYEYLDKVQGASVFHPGIDLNGGNTAQADMGMTVVAPADGKVIYVHRVTEAQGKRQGWGNLLVIEHKHLGLFSRLAHFQSISVNVGDLVKMGQEIGKCGDTGAPGSPHSHWELPNRNLGNWLMYPHGWTKEEVAEAFEDPLATIERLNKQWEVPEYALESVEKACKLGIDKWENPSEIIGSGTMEFIMEDLGAFNPEDQSQKNVSKVRFIHGLDKLGVLDKLLAERGLN